MTITRQQFAALAPAASRETVDALFAPNRDGMPAINRILAEHGITEPHVIAQFLTACSLASDGFTNFNRPIFGLPVLDWFAARAREWHEHGANDDAAAWLWNDIIDGYIGTAYGIPTIYWNEVHKRLADVCAALGVEDRSDRVLPD